MRASRAPAPIAFVAIIGLVLALAGACELVAEPPAPATPSPTATATVRATPVLTELQPTPEPSFLIYQVRPNDKLAAIAKRFKTTVDSIGYWNRGRYATLDPDSAAYRPDSIKIGWLLRIHPGQTTDGDYQDPSPSPKASPSPGASPSPSASPSA